MAMMVCLFFCHSQEIYQHKILEEDYEDSRQGRQRTPESKAL